ncbi:hypothetical protein PIB30_100737 [Stylosanthes scabra]|uniref:Uncharacterized protein n=1 Tax=Stylosanthes scabra TaxID=79078 RepID=A0ABU6ZVV1_9FABA|nr:hypothetical protein [Stylosanthes scabra]
MKRTKLDDLIAKMADPARMGPRPILPSSGLSGTAAAAAAAMASASVIASAAPPAAGASTQLPPVPTASEARKEKKQPSKRERSTVVDLKDELKEDPTADLQQQRRRKKPKFDEAFDKALGADSAWQHEVDPLRVAFPEGFDFRKALNAGLTSAPIREALIKMPPEQLLVESYHLHAKSLACLQVGVETSMAAKITAEKELSAALDHIEILKEERVSALSFVPFKEKATTLEVELSEKSLEHQSALERIAQLEEDGKVLKTQYKSSQLSLETERRRAAAAEEQISSLITSLKTCQADLSKVIEASNYWRSEWHSLGSEVTEMCQETLDVSGPSLPSLLWIPRIGGSSFLRSRTLPQAEEGAPQQGPGVAAQPSQPAAGGAGGDSGECPT